MRRTTARSTLLLAGICLTLAAGVAGCGRTLPQADPEVLKEKKAVLLVLSDQLPVDVQQQLSQAALAAAREQEVALQTRTAGAPFDNNLLSLLHDQPFDEVWVAGSALFSDGMKEASGSSRPQDKASTSAAKNFLFLQTDTDIAALPIQDLPNVKWKHLNDQRMVALWDPWVQEQKQAGKSILWVTDASAAVPANWAPSEEAEAVFRTDLQTGSDWFNQFSYQVGAIQASWVGFWKKPSDSVLSKMNTLRIPTMDLQGSSATTYHWDLIASHEMGALKAKTWKAGAEEYTEEEVSVTRK